MVWCNICFQNSKAAEIYSDNGRLPNVFQELKVPSFTALKSHLKIKVHVMFLEADNLNIFSLPELISQPFWMLYWPMWAKISLFGLKCDYTFIAVWTQYDNENNVVKMFLLEGNLKSEVYTWWGTHVGRYIFCGSPAHLPWVCAGTPGWNLLQLTSGVAPGLFRWGTDSYDEGAKIRLTGC